MKQLYKWIISALAVVSVITTSCVDEIKFGNPFLDKPPGGSATIDTVFGSAIYTQQFLTGIYSRQYYGLPYMNRNYPEIQNSCDLYTGKFEALSDCWHLHWAGAGLTSQYYNGSHTASYSYRQDKFSYLQEWVWEAVRYGYILLENIDRVPDLNSAEKTRMIAETKCLIAARYFDMFRHYGGLPIIRGTFTGTEASFEIPRATVEETVNYMIGLLDDAINANILPWAYDGSTAATSQSYVGRWTKASAMALKCKIWQFAASPLFNDVQGYAGGSSQAEQQHLVWYGGKRPELWQNCLQACKEFFEENEKNGNYYQLRQASANTPTQYRQAYRMGYILQGSREVLHSVRVRESDNHNNGNYQWHAWQSSKTKRLNYNPTQEYIEMFPWADGTPFDWNALAAQGKEALNTMFAKGEIDPQTHYQKTELTRDPRLYETARINGTPNTVDWTTGEMGQQPFEAWVGGYDAGMDPKNESELFATGYSNMKYWLGDEYIRQPLQWVYLRYSDLMLIYAEALLQANNDNVGALKWIDEIRARVGMKGLAECNPDKNLTADHDALLEELLRERVCELGMEDSRFFDLIRYKREDLFEKRLHGLRIYRMGYIKKENGETVYGRIEKQWYGSDQNSKMDQPIDFEYEKFELSNPTRYWWDHGFDAKWYLSPFPQTEINKGYGLIQNPGW